MLVPDYYEDFHCIGAECEETCCAHWHISFERALYERLLDHPHPVLGPMFQAHIQRNGGDNATDERFATMRLRPEGSCPFHDPDQLCLIQKTLGADWLPNVCATYPRIVTEMDGAPEASLTVSCPEAARVVLARRQPIEFRQIADDARLIGIPHRHVNRGDGPLSPWVGDIRQLCLRILQSRPIPLDARLQLLAEFTLAAEQLVASGNEAQFPALMTGVAQHLDGETKALDAFLAYPANTRLKLQILAAALIHLLSLGNHRHFGIFVGGAMESLGQTSNPNDILLDDFERNYNAAYRASGRDFLDHHAHLLENYLVNLAFTGLFPFGGGGSQMFSSCCSLIINFSLIKLVLVGLAAHPAGVGEKEAIAVIQSFSRWADHSPEKLRELHQLVTERGWNSPAAMAMLLREAS